MAPKQRSGSLFPKWDAANQRRADRANAEALERPEMYQEVDAPEGRRTVCALRIGEPLNDYGELDLVILPLSMIWMRLVGRGDYHVVVCRTTRLGRLRPVYRSERMSKAAAKDHVAALVALADSAVGAGEQTTP